MIVIISYEVENFVVQSWNFVRIQFLVFWLENEEYCHSKFFNERTRNNNLDRDLARNLSKQIIRYLFFSRKFESTYFGDTNVLSDSFERQTRGRHVRNPGTHGFRVEPTLISQKVGSSGFRVPTKFFFVPTPAHESIPTA